MLKAVLLLGVSFKLADSFFVPITGRWHSTSASCCPSRSYCSTGRGEEAVCMFGNLFRDLEMLGLEMLGVHVL